MGSAVDGIVSGLDTSSIISALVSASAANRTRMKQQLADIELKKDHFTTLQDHITALQSAITDINTASEFKKMSATSSESDRVSPEVTGVALAGSYTVNISQLASAQTSKTSKSYADGTTAFITAGSPELYVSVNGAAATTVSLTTNTLDGAISAINDANLGMQAYKVQQSDGTYLMMVTGEDTGEDYDFTITTNDTDTTPLSFTTLTSAQDTLGTVNGVSVRSNNNIISDVIPGVTLTLFDDTDLDDNGVSDDTTVTIGTDLSGIKDAIKNFVDKYNTVQSYISFEVKYNDSSKEAGPLASENLVRQIQRTLQDKLRATYTSNTDIDVLSSLGITTLKDGTLEIDDTDLSDALSDHFSQVINFFTADDGLFNALTNDDEDGTLDYLLDSTDGTLKTKFDSLDEQIDTYNEEIEKEDDRLSAMEARLRAQFTAMEVALGKLKLTGSYVDNLSALSTKNK